MIYNKPRDFIFKAPAPEKEKKQKKQKVKKESSVTEIIVIKQKPKREEVIKIAKDCGSAATFVVFVVTVILNLIIFIPKIIMLF